MSKERIFYSGDRLCRVFISGYVVIEKSFGISYSCSGKHAFVNVENVIDVVSVVRAKSFGRYSVFLFDCVDKVLRACSRRKTGNVSVKVCECVGVSGGSLVL